MNKRAGSRRQLAASCDSLVGVGGRLRPGPHCGGGGSGLDHTVGGGGSGPDHTVGGEAPARTTQFTQLHVTSQGCALTYRQPGRRWEPYIPGTGLNALTCHLTDGTADHDFTFKWKGKVTNLSMERSMYGYLFTLSY